MTRTTRLVAVALMALGSSMAGIITGVGTRIALGANDMVQWGTAGQDGSFVSSPLAVVSVGGINVSAAVTGGLAIYVQNGGGGYVGAFSPGEILLDSAFNTGPITIDFATAVRGVGLNVMSLNFGAFTGTMQFFGAGNTLFGSVNVNGTSSSANDGSAPFLGGTSSLRDITRVVISTSGAGTELTINQMSLLTTDPSSGGDIPEPSTVTLLSAALVGGVWLRRRRS
jgi:hypothetical protein